MGFLSLIQIFFLPGLILNGFIKNTSGGLYKISFIVAYSMLFNLMFVVMLVLINAYHFNVILSLIIIETVILIFQYRKIIQQPLRNPFRSVLLYFSTKIKPLFSANEVRGARLTFVQFIKIIAFTIASISVLWVLFDFAKQIGSVFSYWDSVISYNRWASEWSMGVFPTGACEYPQLLPVNWSITYVLTQSQVITFAKLVQGIFPILFIFAMFDLGVTFGSSGFLLSVPLALFILKKFTVVSLFEGYMDVAVTTLILLSFYMILKDLLQNQYSKKTIWLSGIVMLAAAMVKQPGVLAFGAWVLVNFLLLNSKKLGERLISVKKLVFPTLVILVTIASWYVLKSNIDAIRGEHSCIAITNSWVVNDFVSGYWEVLHYRLRLLGPWVVLLPILFTSAFFIKGPLRLLVLCYGIPYMLVSLVYGHVGMFSRYLTPISFVFALTSAMLFDYLINFFLKLVEKIKDSKFQKKIMELGRKFTVVLKKIYYLPIWVSLILALILLGFISMKYSDAKLIRNYEYNQMGIGNRIINDYLVEFYKDKDPQDLTLTWYPYINYLPGLAGRAINFNGTSTDELLAFSKNENVRYVLYDADHGEVFHYLMDLVQNGQAILITDFGIENDAILIEITR
jgi:hypothetical protein